MTPVLRWVIVAVVLAAVLTLAWGDWAMLAFALLSAAFLELLYRVYLRSTDPKRRLSN